MSATKSLQRVIPGIMSSRLMAGFFTGGTALMALTGGFASAPELIIPALVASTAGATGSIAYGVSRIKKESHRDVKKFFLTDTSGINKLSITKSLLGIPFEPQSVLINTTPYAPSMKNRLAQALVNAPLEVQRVMIQGKSYKANPLPAHPNWITQVDESILLSSARFETENYIVCKPGAVYLEQRIKPTALKTWDDAFEAAGLNESQNSGASTSVLNSERAASRLLAPGMVQQNMETIVRTALNTAFPKKKSEAES